MKLNQGQIFDLLQRHYFTPEGAATMAAIALAESGGDTLSDCIDCVPGVHEASLGLFQINVLAHPEYPPTCLHDPDCAANAAYILSNKGSDFTPWSTYNNGAYKRFYVAPGNIAGQNSQASDPGALNDAINKAGDIGGNLKAMLPGGSNPAINYENAAIAGIVAVVAIAMVFFGIYGLVKGEAEKVVLAAGKVA